MDNTKDMQERAARAAFTPGPWEAGKAQDGTWYIHEAAALGFRPAWQPGGCIAAVRPAANSEANAALLTASPDLASVMSALLDDMEDRYDGAPDSGMGWMGWHISKGREALAKAGSK